MVYRWYCCWENRASHWADFEKCGAGSRYWYRDKKKAEEGAKRHEYATGHKTYVYGLDGRKVKGRIRD